MDDPRRPTYAPNPCGIVHVLGGISISKVSVAAVSAGVSDQELPASRLRRIAGITRKQHTVAVVYILGYAHIKNAIQSPRLLRPSESAQYGPSGRNRSLNCG